MQDLATPDDFARSRRPLVDATLIVAFTFRVLTFTGILLLIGADWSATGTEFWRSFFLAIAIGVVLGLVAAVPAYFAERGRDPAKLPQKVSQILADGAGLLPPPPPDARARLLCAIALPKRRFAGGMLYVTPVGLVFQPHYGPGSWWSQKPRPTPESFTLGPANSIVASPGFFPSPRPRLAALLSLTPSEALVVDWADGTAAFTVPNAAKVLERLQPHLDAIRAGCPAV